MKLEGIRAGDLALVDVKGRLAVVEVESVTPRKGISFRVLASAGPFTWSSCDPRSIVAHYARRRGDAIPDVLFTP